MERDRQDAVLRALYKQKSDLIEKASVRWIDHNYNLVFDNKTERMLEQLNKQIFEHHINRLKELGSEAVNCAETTKSFNKREAAFTRIYNKMYKDTKEMVDKS